MRTIALVALAALADGLTLLPAQSVLDRLPPQLPPGVTPAMVVRGEEVFKGEGLCHTCHGAEAGGYLGPDLTDDEWWHAEGSYLELINRILRGVPREESTVGLAMEPRGGMSLSEAEVQAVAAYVWRLSHPETPDSLPMGVSRELVDEGDRIFHRPGGCVRCHGADARGDLGPDLTDHEWLHAKGDFLSIVQTIITGVPQERSRTGVIMPPRGGSAINDADVYAVAAYVWALSRLRWE